MKKTNNARYALSLIIATILMVFTMALHPSGGSIEYIQKISGIIMVTHGLAILSVPFWILGFWGLSRRLENGNLISLAAFIIMTVGLFAVVIAAAVNGLALPLFVNHYIDATPEKLSAIKPLINYNTALNHAFDFIYIGASCLAVLLWSFAILRTKRLPVWVGWFGVILVATAFIPIKSGFFITGLMGFRIFVLGFATWTIMIIVTLRSLPINSSDNNDGL